MVQSLNDHLLIEKSWLHKTVGLGSMGWVYIVASICKSVTSGLYLHLASTVARDSSGNKSIQLYTSLTECLDLEEGRHGAQVHGL